MTDKEKARLDFARQSVSFKPDNQIADTAKISPRCSIGRDGFGFARDEEGKLVKIHHRGGVRIGDHVEVRDFATIDRATNEGTFTEIGEGNQIDHHCHFAHNVKVGIWNTFANGCSIEGSCEVGDYNTFGSMVVMQRKTKIGSNCTIGSGSIITRDFPDNCIIVGAPARLVRFKP